MTGSICGADACTNDARRRYCSSACASRDRQRRYRKETHRRVDVSVVLDFRAPTAFGVPTTDDVAEIFRDDAVRFRQMGYI